MDNLPQFNIVDIVAIILILLGLIRGLAKGLSGELAGLISVGLAVYAGWRLYRPLGEYFTDKANLGTDTSAYLAAFVVALIGAYVLMLLLRILLRNLMQFSFKGKLEKLGGALAGLAKTLAIVTAGLLALALLPNTQLHRLCAEDSVLGGFVYRTLGPVVAEKYPQLAPAVQAVEELPEITDVEEIPAGESLEIPAGEDIREIPAGETIEEIPAGEDMTGGDD
ncbi:MAG TPA: CvpA family protein [Kiritimatiellia bacterium]|nr:CvpA family protein [Kiritimatiellia bacterium]